ncbi:MAG: hypothetical protein ACO3FI_08280 [Cyclobacteriaceae bacterium]
MIRILSRLISVIMHPLWMPFFLFICLTKFPPSFTENEIRGYALSLIVLLLTGVLPAFNLILFRILGTIPDLALAQQKDRTMPFMFITMVYAGSAYLFYQQYPISWAFKLLLLTASASMAGTLITLWFKISIHALAISGVTAIIVFTEMIDGEGLLFMPSISAVVLSGVVMSARLWLEAHTLGEVLAGAVTGAMITTIGMTILF